MKDVIIRIEHCRRLLYCSRGIRDLLNRYGFDYSDFLANGVSAEALLAASGNDAMVLAVAEVANEQK